ncbi:MAG: SDR family oxidoreductase, partial [Acidimicrobiales bacterium]
MSDTLGSNGSIALTGATGFLGRAVLAQLLATTDAEMICLVRADTAADARDRGLETLAAALDRQPTPAESARVSWLRADIEEVRLGLDETTWTQLASTIGDVFHCAASVRFDLDLEDAQRINVDGTSHVLEVATEANRQGHFGCFHHVSTAYVAGKTKGHRTADFLPSDRAGNFRNSYERTKARCERMLRSQTEVPVSIYRPSIVGGTIETGRTDNWNVLYVPMRMIANGHLPVAPIGGEALVDTVGYDYVARAMVHLATTDRGGFVGHHLTAGHPFTVGEFITTTKRVAHSLDKSPSAARLVHPGRWRLLTAMVTVAARAPKWTGRVRTGGRLAANVLRKATPYAPYTSVSSGFDNRRERSMLEPAGISMP